MTVLRQQRFQWRLIAPLPGFAALLLAPGLAIHWGFLPFEYRIPALLLRLRAVHRAVPSGRLLGRGTRPQPSL